MVIVAVVMVVAVVLRTDVFHLVDATAFGASLDWAVAGDLSLKVSMLYFSHVMFRLFLSFSLSLSLFLCVCRCRYMCGGGFPLFH